MDTFGEHRVTHVGIVVDASSSMMQSGLRDSLVKVFDSLVQTLAARSQELKEEVRISVWSFSGEVDWGRNKLSAEDAVKNMVWDIDILRLPSIEKHYHPWGNTALIDGALTAIWDMKKIPTMYGDHSFLVFVITDGRENRSKNLASRLKDEITGLPEEWSLGALVPDTMGVAEAKRYGFPAGNIEMWNTAANSGGAMEMGESITRAASAYLTSRSQGVRGTTQLFDTSAASVNTAAVKASGMKEADPASYLLHFIPPVTHPFPKALSRRAKFRIDEYIKNTLGLPFRLGANYYEQVRTETVSPNKDIALVHRKTGKVYIGREARDMVGLPNETVRLRPNFNEEFHFMIRSDSTNRNLVEGQRILVIR